MNISELWTEMELEHSWRLDEIRWLQNHMAAMTSDGEQDRFRRALILMLYAHFEGFCKFAFSLYVGAVNREGIPCSQANYALAAVSLSDLFRALRDPNKKCNEFKRGLPDDSALHRFARDREFVEQSRAFEARPARIPDNVVDIESNLKPVVLSKILYRLGFQHDCFSELTGEIQMLLSYRNDIGHGKSKEGISFHDYDKVKRAADRIMAEIKVIVMNALQEKRYLRAE